LPDILQASTKEMLWHTLRQSLAAIYPETNDNDLLMCCGCGRFLSFDAFSIEHILPKQFVSDDPEQVRQDADMPVSTRSGLTLLCKQRLLVKERVIGNGCNGWKGRFYDGCLKAALRGRLETAPFSEQHLVALQCAAYLALVREFGYAAAATSAGAMLRRQFFNPRSFVRDMPFTSQMALAAPPPAYDAGLRDHWAKPFTIAFDQSPKSCVVTFRSAAMRVPISRDPRLPVATKLKIVPPRFLLRPDFSSPLF
jgi:hypothetical protein